MDTLPTISATQKYEDIFSIFNSYNFSNSSELTDEKLTKTKLAVMSGLVDLNFECSNINSSSIAKNVLLLIDKSVPPIEERFAYFITKNGRGTVIGYDAIRDLALVKINGKLPERVKEIPLSKNLPEVGSDVHAIGHPNNFSWTYSKGYISQIRNKFNWNYKDTKHTANIIQTQTPISTGNSGGPLIDNDANLIGVNSFKSQGENLNFAVTSLEVVDFVNGLSSSLTREPEKIKPKTTKKVAKKVDSNNDGKPDTFYIDEDGDGKIDFVLKDSNHNGKPDMIGTDTNGDGKPDIIAVDRGEDGIVDIWYVDIDFDGKPDASATDTNGDGKPDKYKKIV